MIEGSFVIVEELVELFVGRSFPVREGMVGSPGLQGAAAGIVLGQMGRGFVAQPELAWS